MLRALLLLPLLATSALAAPTDVALVPRPAPGSVSPARHDEIVALLARELAAAGLPITIMPTEVKERLAGTPLEQCVKGLECLFRIGRALEADVVVALEATEFEGDVAVTLEAIVPAEERRAAKKTVVVRAEALAARFPEQARAFADEAARALPVPRDAPTRPPELTLTPWPSPAPVESFHPAPPSRTGSWVAAGGAGVAAAAAVVFALLGRADDALLSRSVPGDPRRSRLTYPEATALADSANREYTLAIASGVTAAGLSALAIWLWPEEPSSDSGGGGR